MKGFVGLIKNLWAEFNFSMLIFFETRANGGRTKRITQKLGFDGQFIQEVNGQSSGIRCLWDTNLWTINVISNSFQFVHLKVNLVIGKCGSSLRFMGAPTSPRDKAFWRV